MGLRRVAEVVSQRLETDPNCRIVGAAGAEADECRGTQQGDDDVAAEGSGEDLVDRARHLIGSGRQFDAREDLGRADILAEAVSARDEQVRELTGSGSDPLTQRVEPPQRAGSGDGGSVGPHLGDDFEADVFGEGDEAPGGSLIAETISVPEEEGCGGMGSLGPGHRIDGVTDRFEVGQRDRTVKAWCRHRQKILVRRCAGSHPFERELTHLAWANDQAFHVGLPVPARRLAIGSTPATSRRGHRARHLAERRAPSEHNEEGTLVTKSSMVRKGVDKATKFAFDEDGSLTPRTRTVLSKVLSVQRPVALAFVRSMRRKHPDATPEELIRIIRRRYLALTTTGGAAVGATAAIPGLGTAAALGVAAAETAGFLETTALFAQSISEIHGLPVRDKERANVLVLGLMLGPDGKNLVQKFSKSSGGTDSVLGQWGAVVTKQLPAPVLDLLLRKMRKTFIRKFATRAGGSVVGRVLPFGIGAVIGAVVNGNMSRKVAHEADLAFGPAPSVFPLETDPEFVAPKTDNRLLGTLKNVIELRERLRKNKSVESTVVDEELPEIER